jgi:hypothetical protein
MGKPAQLKAEMAKEIENYGPSPEGDPANNLSRWEFEHAAEHISGLLDAADQQSIMRVHANGYASIDHATGVVTPMGVAVTIESLGRLLE